MDLELQMPIEMGYCSPIPAEPSRMLRHMRHCLCEVAHAAVETAVSIDKTAVVYIESVSELSVDNNDVPNVPSHRKYDTPQN